MTSWKWCAASQCGAAHAQLGDRRQDAYRVVTAASAFLIAVACDGAGSSSHGQYGAALAARVLTSRAKEWIDRHEAMPAPALIELWVAEVRLMIIASADRTSLVAGDFATTLVMAISDGTTTTTAHIGDGAIVARCVGAARLEELSWPENGEYASTTFFLTDLVPRLRIGIIAHLAVDRIAVLTDGLERLALDFSERAPHNPFFDRLFAAVARTPVSGRNAPLSRQLAAFISSDAVNARTDDDKTLIVAALR